MQKARQVITIAFSLEHLCDTDVRERDMFDDVILEQNALVCSFNESANILFLSPNWIIEEVALLYS